ncbi:TetR family transcriptional regulator [Paenibacillus sp. PR3]|uniref:TetR family transcriptional regulator n=1 Tax=Paenibacillus terricola TaxID=2763503 RepID=A0ABR8N163_9BACL|nr:TetR family transcriptional regulator [Paenibacillus terricola]MBD3921926.1 TetR family transcriptional regulator [Paenibacillus terricola]
MNKLSLRDIKKEATANALAEAAFELALDKGLDGFVVEDIVQRAGYSRRTFANHFSCKEEAVAAAAVIFKDAPDEEELVNELAETASMVDILHQLMRMQFTVEQIKTMRKLVKLSVQFPTLEPYILTIFHQFQRKAQHILSRCSRGRHSEMYTHLLAGAMYGAALPLLNSDLPILFQGEPDVDMPGAMTFEQYLDEMFKHLSNGF